MPDKPKTPPKRPAKPAAPKAKAKPTPKPKAKPKAAPQAKAKPAPKGKGKTNPKAPPDPKQDAKAKAKARTTGRRSRVEVIMEQAHARTKQGPGRPSALNPDVLNTITRLIKEGNYISTACLAVGISKTTFCNWMNRGEAAALIRDTAPDGEDVLIPDAEFLEFLDSVLEAEAQYEAALVSTINRHAKKNGFVALDFLARRRRERWSRDKATAQVSRTTDNGDGTVTEDVFQFVIDDGGRGFGTNGE